MIVINKKIFLKFYGKVINNLHYNLLDRCSLLFYIKRTRNFKQMQMQNPSPINSITCEYHELISDAFISYYHISNFLVENILRKRSCLTSSWSSSRSSRSSWPCGGQLCGSSRPSWPCGSSRPSWSRWTDRSLSTFIAWWTRGPLNKYAMSMSIQSENKSYFLLTKENVF